MKSNEYEIKTTGNTLVNTWVMKITADRRIEVNEDIEVTEAAKKVLECMQTMLKQRTPPCPKDLFQYDCAIEDVDLVCFLEYSPEEKGYTDSYGAPYEPDIEECMTLNNAYIAGTDVDIAHMILQSLVDHVEVSALEKFLDK
jgi:hypothetical protein